MHASRLLHAQCPQAKGTIAIQSSQLTSGRLCHSLDICLFPLLVLLIARPLVLLPLVPYCTCTQSRSKPVPIHFSLCRFPLYCWNSLPRCFSFANPMTLLGSPRPRGSLPDLLLLIRVLPVCLADFPLVSFPREVLRQTLLPDHCCRRFETYMSFV
jgi:hypothetical protein